MRRVAALTVAVWFLGLGCAHAPRVSDSRTREQMQDTLRQSIPPGTPAAEAMATLNKDGFGCSRNTNVPIPDLGLDGPLPEETGDYIYAERVADLAPLVPLSGERRWRVVLILKDGVVERYRTYFSVSGG